MKEIIKVPGYDYVHVVGTESEGDIGISDYITDGERDYEIVSIPFMHGSIDKQADEVDIYVRAGDHVTNHLIGKKLYAVES